MLLVITFPKDTIRRFTFCLLPTNQVLSIEKLLFALVVYYVAKSAKFCHLLNGTLNPVTYQS